MAPVSNGGGRVKSRVVVGVVAWHVWEWLQSEVRLECSLAFKANKSKHMNLKRKRKHDKKEEENTITIKHGNRQTNTGNKNQTQKNKKNKMAECVHTRSGTWVVAATTRRPNH